ncbi:hypothetical protein FQN54_009424 [Arachnomyces sp. PD_36]|nr:hypothetical protein FQN54_009424 [Arachnomyces sp. PD_36]
MLTDSDISLVDNTLPTPQTDEDNNSESSSFQPGRRTLSKRFTKGSVREGLARRKYAKWQSDRFTEETDEGSAAENSDRSRAKLLPVRKLRGRSPSRGGAGPSNQAAGAAAAGTDVAGQPTNIRTGESRSTSAGTDKRESEIDILYENQRGWFFFGIPLYSRQSLLNLDPAGWETSQFKPSPVDISNAQLPDPSWEWVWKTWYVDMSYDVDEEGWQYSFSFSPKFAWHGTQPWFHSFVRRRRWLRKRAKRKVRGLHGKMEMEVSHMLNDEYFTIHPSMFKSRESSAGPASGARSSFVSRRSAQMDDYLVPGEIGDVLALMRCLKSATVDREKIEVVKQFVAQGGDDLFYLGERISEIMSFFIFQHSRRQLIDYLQSVVDEISNSRTESSGRTDQEVQAETRKLEYLRKAVEAAETQIGESEYWSDIRVSTDGKDRPLLDGETSPCPSKPTNNDGAGPDGFAGVIRGIPEEAGVGVDEGLSHIRDEPLTFLYPRWFTTVVQHPATRRSTKIAPGKGFGEETHAGNSKRRIGDSPRRLRTWQKPAVEGKQFSKTSSQGPEEQARHRDDGEGSSSTWSVDFKKLRQNPLSSDRKADSPRFSIHRYSLADITPLSNPIPPSQRADSLPEAPPREPQTDADQEVAADREPDPYERQVEKDFYLKSLGTLEQLTRGTKSTKTLLSRDQKAIYLSEEELNVLAGSSSENKWMISSRSGCWIHVLKSEESEGLHRKTILSGSPRAIELAEESIATQLKSRGLGESSPAGSPRILPSSNLGQGPPLIRSVWIEPRRETRTSKVGPIRPDEIPVPEKWTTLKFAEYVQALTDIEVPRTVNRQLYKEGESHVGVLDKMLYDLFNDPANEMLLSTRAVNLALSWLHNHRCVPTVRALFPKLTPFLTVESFNFILRSVAADKNMQAFSYYLELMEKLDIQVDGKTWVAFVKALSHQKLRSRAVSYMKGSGLLDKPNTLRLIASTTAGEKLTSHLNRGGNAKSFLKKLNKEWGVGWLSVTAVNGLIHSAIKLGDWGSCLEIIRFCQEQNLRLNVRTMNISLTFFRKKGLMTPALQLFHYMTKRYDIEHNYMTTQTLFSTAWRTRNYNLCRVLWRYMCMKGDVTFDTENRVFHSLLKNTIKTGLDKWVVSAGKVMVGVDPDTSSLMSKFEFLKDEIDPRTGKPITDPVMYLVGHKPDGPERKQQRELAKAMLHRDLDAARKFVPEKSLQEMLDEASLKDREWELKRLTMGVGINTPYFIRKAVEVPVKEAKTRRTRTVQGLVYGGSR